MVSPGLFGCFRRCFVPLEPVGDTMHMNVYANAHISVPSHHQRQHDHKMIQNMRKLTYPKRHVSTKMPSLVPRQEASKVRRRSSAHPSQTHLAGAAQLVEYI